MMHRLIASHATEFAEVGITMTQAKLLYVVMAAGRLRMSELAARLGIGSSSATRARGPARRAGAAQPARGPGRPTPGRRHRDTRGGGAPRALPRAQPPPASPAPRPARRRGARHRRPFARRPPRRHRSRRHRSGIDRPASHHPPGEASVSRLSRVALSKRSVTLLFAAALFFAGASAWGSLKQELLPDIDFPVITVVTPYPGAGSSDVTEQITKPIENAISGVPRLEVMQSTSSNSISLVVTQFSFGTNVKETTAAITDAIAKANLPAQRDADDPGAQHQRHAGRRVVDRGDRQRWPRGGGAHRPDRDRPRDRGDRGRRPCRPDRRSRGAGLHHPRSGQDGRGRDHQSAGRQHPAGQQPDPAIGPDLDRRVADPGVDHRDVQLGRRDRAPRRRLRTHRPDRPGRRGVAGGQRRPGRTQADHARRSRDGRARPRRDDRVRSHERRPRADPDRLQGLEREHRRGRRRRPGQARRDRRASPVAADDHDGPGPVDLHQGVAPTASSARAGSARSSRS